MNLKRTFLLSVEDNDDQWLIAQRALLLTLPNVKTIRTTTLNGTLNQLQEQYQKEAELPRLILLDLYLPDRQDGLQLISRLKTIGDSFHQIPIVVLSSSSQSQDIADTYQAGIGSYVVKPQSFDQWIELFNRIRIYWWETSRSSSTNRFLF